MSRFRTPACALVALIALCCQLWLVTAHAYAALPGQQAAHAEFCGGGDAQSAQALRAQLAPELRALPGGVEDCCDGACQSCAPPCSPAVPGTTVAFIDLPRPDVHLLRLAVREVDSRPRQHRPPATGPPTMR